MKIGITVDCIVDDKIKLNGDKHYVYNLYTMLSKNHEVYYIIDSKTLLQEWSQSKKLGLPRYTLLEKLGPDHDPIFTIKVEVLNNKFRIGNGNTIQDAEQDAAQKFLNNINKINEKKTNSNY